MQNKKEKFNFSINFLCLNSCKEPKEFLENLSVSSFFRKEKLSSDSLNFSGSISKMGTNNLKFIQMQKSKFSLLEYPKDKLFHLKHENNGIIAKITSKNLSKHKEIK